MKKSLSKFGKVIRDIVCRLKNKKITIRDVLYSMITAKIYRPIPCTNKYRFQKIMGIRRCCSFTFKLAMQDEMGYPTSLNSVCSDLGFCVVECALTFHNQVKNRRDDIEKVFVKTQESAVRIIEKKSLYNLPPPADCNHCI